MILRQVTGLSAFVQQYCTTVIRETLPTLSCTHLPIRKCPPKTSFFNLPTTMRCWGCKSMNMRKEFWNTESHHQRSAKVQIKSCYVQKTSLVIQKTSKDPCQCHTSAKDFLLRFVWLEVHTLHFGWSWPTVTTENGRNKIVLTFSTKRFPGYKVPLCLQVVDHTGSLSFSYTKDVDCFRQVFLRVGIQILFQILVTHQKKQKKEFPLQKEFMLTIRGLHFPFPVKKKQLNKCRSSK